MQITQILVSLVVISIVQAAWFMRIPKPRLNSLLSRKLDIPEILKHKLPEERRKFSLFPKSYMKYVISPEAIYKIAIHNLMAHGTKKPLMKKLSQLEKKNKVVENEAEQPPVYEETVYGNYSVVTPKLNPAVINKEASLEDVEENSVESSEKHNDSSEEKHTQHNDSKEIKIEKADAEEKEFPNLLVLIPPRAKPDVSYTNKNSKENESSDSVEFIFIDPTHKPTDSKKSISEEPEEYVTTEFYEESEIVRRKRYVSYFSTV